MSRNRGPEAHAGYVQGLAPASLSPIDPAEQARQALAGFRGQTPSRVPCGEGHYRSLFDSEAVLVPKCGHARQGRWFEQ